MQKIKLIEQYYISNKESILANIHEKGTNLCIWKRRVKHDIIHYAKHLTKIPNFSFEFKLSDKDSLLEKFPPFDDGTAKPFIDDVLGIALRFQEITKIQNPKVHLSVINDMQCPLFHVDYVQMRLICTYIGQGTLWVPNADVNRNHLGCGRNDHLIRSMDAVRQAENFDVLIMKGEANESDPKNGLIHKSPDTKGEPRLFLRMDAR